MEAIDPHHDHPEQPDHDGGESPPASEETRAVVAALLAGRFFTLDRGGQITMWSAAAASTFGYSRRDVLGTPLADALLAPPARPAAQQRLDALLEGAGTAFALELDAVTSAGGAVPMAFNVLPIAIDVSYEFNELLQKTAGGAQEQGSIAETRAREEAVRKLVEGALADRPPGAGEDGPRLAGVLVVFERPASQAPEQPEPGKVVPLVEVVPAEAPAEESELRTLRSQLEDLRREAQRSRERVDEASQEAADARDELAAARRDTEAARHALDDMRRERDEARAAVEAGRMRLEEATRDAERARSELVEAREENRRVTARLEEELAAARAQREPTVAEARTPLSPPPAADGEAPLAPEDAELLTTERLREALEAERFELYAQPLLDLRSGEIAQHELLLRMRAADGRVLLPQAFLAPARRAGVASGIDRWVVRRALALLVRDASERSLEVNLSPEAVHDEHLISVLDEHLMLTGVDPARLVLELTGDIAAADLDATRALARQLRARGCRFALDDFHSTFGSFRLLKELPLDLLKLDGELVGSLTDSRTSELIVKALVDVAGGTGMKTVAVFVADERTLDVLREHGVDYAQGYAVGRPQPATELWPG